MKAGWAPRTRGWLDRANEESRSRRIAANARPVGEAANGQHHGRSRDSALLPVAVILSKTIGRLKAERAAG